MRYKELHRERKFRGPVHWGHTITMLLMPARVDELIGFLDETVGVNNYRSKHLESTRRGPPNFPNKIKLRFADKNYAMRVKLMWSECEWPGRGFDDFFSRLYPPQIAMANVVTGGARRGSVTALAGIGAGSGKSMMTLSLINQMYSKLSTPTTFLDFESSSEAIREREGLYIQYLWPPRRDERRSASSYQYAYQGWCSRKQKKRAR